MTSCSVFLTLVNEEDWQHICHFKKLMVREDHSNKDNILPFSAHNTNLKGWKAVNQPHLPNHT